MCAINSARPRFRFLFQERGEHYNGKDLYLFDKAVSADSLSHVSFFLSIYSHLFPVCH